MRGDPSPAWVLEGKGKGKGISETPAYQGRVVRVHPPKMAYE